MPKKLTQEEVINRCKKIHPEYNTFTEYNGQQHYIPIEYFGGELKFREQVARDKYVRNYCKANAIKLIEIKYDENVVECLGNELR